MLNLANSILLISRAMHLRNLAVNGYHQMRWLEIIALNLWKSIDVFEEKWQRRPAAVSGERKGKTAAGRRCHLKNFSAVEYDQKQRTSKIDHRDVLGSSLRLHTVGIFDFTSYFMSFTSLKNAIKSVKSRSRI